MRDNALYFPYISVPDEAWTMKTLLYWDKFSSIVPMSYLENPNELSPFMRTLVEEELVEQIVPAFHLYKVSNFEENFIAMIEARQSKFRVPRVKPRVQIHMEKLGEIPYYLLERGLAVRGRYPWFEVDTDVASLFMAYLAACLGSIPEVNAAPVTNKLIFAAVFGASTLSQEGRGGLHRSKARSVILHSLLPAPAGKIDVAEVVRFKNRYGHLLPALRRKVEAGSFQLAMIEDHKDRLTATENFIAQSKQEVYEIEEAMKQTWTKVTMGSLAPLFGNGLALHAAGFDNKVVAAGAVSSFIGAAYQAVVGVHGHNAQMMGRPLAYVAHARRRFGD